MLNPPKSGLLLHYSPIQKSLNCQQEGKYCPWAETWTVHLAFFLAGLEGTMERGKALLQIYKQCLMVWLEYEGTWKEQDERIHKEGIWP